MVPFRMPQRWGKLTKGTINWDYGISIPKDHPTYIDVFGDYIDSFSPMNYCNLPKKANDCSEPDAKSNPLSILSFT